MLDAGRRRAAAPTRAASRVVERRAPAACWRPSATSRRSSRAYERAAAGRALAAHRRRARAARRCAPARAAELDERYPRPAALGADGVLRRRRRSRSTAGCSASWRCPRPRARTPSPTRSSTSSSTLGRQCAQALRARPAVRRRARGAASAWRSSRWRARGWPSRWTTSTTLDAVAELAVPAIGDWCSVHLLDDAGEPQLVTVHHRDAELQALLEELFERYPPDPDARRRHRAGASASGGTRAPPALRRTRRCARSPATTGTSTRCAGSALGSALVVPLLVRGRVIGVLTVDRGELDAYADDDVRSSRTSPPRMATAVDNAAALPAGARDRADAAALAAAARAARAARAAGRPPLPARHGRRRGRRRLVRRHPAARRPGRPRHRRRHGPRRRGRRRHGPAARRGARLRHGRGQRPAVLLRLVDAAMSSLGSRPPSPPACTASSTRPAAAAAAGQRRAPAAAGGAPRRRRRVRRARARPAARRRAAGAARDRGRVPDGAVLLLFTDGLVEGRAPAGRGAACSRCATPWRTVGAGGSTSRRCATRCCARWAATAGPTTTARCSPSGHRVGAAPARPTTTCTCTWPATCRRCPGRGA